MLKKKLYRLNLTILGCKYVFSPKLTIYSEKIDINFNIKRKSIIVFFI